MCIIKRAASRWLQLAVGIFLVVSICVFVGVGIMIQYQDLLDKADGLKKFIPPSSWPTPPFCRSSSTPST